MIDGATAGLVLGGLVLLVSGAALSVYGVVALGVVLGGGGGHLLAPSLGGLLGLDGVFAAGAPILLGALAGGVVGYVLLSAAVALAGFVVGAFLAMATLVPLVLDHQWYLEWTGALAVGLVVAVLATLFTKSTLVGLTAIVGAAFVSRSLTLEQFGAARRSLSPEPLLFDVGSPTFLALVAVGVLAQFGLVRLGGVARLRRLVPGRGRAGRRGGEPDPTR